MKNADNAKVRAVRVANFGRRRNARRGFTLVELLMSMLIAVVVISAATSFTVTTWKGRRAWTLREGVDRNARFIGMTLARDAQDAGVAIESTPVFASINSQGDTLSILSVPFDPLEAPVYSIFNDGAPETYYPAGGNCGTFCIKFKRNAGTFTLAAGNLARLQVGTERRLVYLEQAAGDGPSEFQVIVKNAQKMLGRQAGLSDSIRLARSGTTIQKLKAVVYWRDASTETLYRADRFTSDGTPIAEVAATGVEQFRVRLIFLGGYEYPEYNGTDADTLNDGNRIIGVRVEAVLKADHADPAVNGGLPVRRSYEWRVAPRNLLYEKNRR